MAAAISLQRLTKRDGRIDALRGEEAVNGVLRLALNFISVPNLLRKLEPVWSQFYSHGRMTIDQKEKAATIELHEFPLVSATHCARVTGWFEWFAQKAEKSAAVRHSTCRARGDAQCRWEVIW